jgi:hypothetical protein
MYKSPIANEKLVVHELGHMFDRAVCAAASGAGACSPNDWWHGESAHSDMTGKMGTGTNGLGRPDYQDESGRFHGFAGGGGDWQFAVSNKESTVEVWADMFLGWTYDTWGGDDRGTARQAYMNNQMGSYIGLFIP